MQHSNIGYWPDILIGLATFVMSVGASMFVAGRQWGEVRSEMRYMNDRLAKIEGMFVLAPREARHDGS
jgi:hypothetical protein